MTEIKLKTFLSVLLVIFVLSFFTAVKDSRAGFAQVQLVCCQFGDECADNQDLPPNVSLACPIDSEIVDGAVCNEATNMCELSRNVPALSTWGLLATAVVLGAVGFFIIRRMKPVA